MTTATNIGKALSVVQLLQMGLSLVDLARNTLAGGRQEVSEEDLHAALAENDEALADFQAAIDRAKSEGR